MTCGEGAGWNEAGGALPHKVWVELQTRPSTLRFDRGGKGEKTGPSPVNERRPGSKHHIICEGRGIPLAVILTGGNRHDITELLPLVDRVPPTGRYGKFRPKDAAR